MQALFSLPLRQARAPCHRLGHRMLVRPLPPSRHLSILATSLDRRRPLAPRLHSPPSLLIPPWRCRTSSTSSSAPSPSPAKPTALARLQPYIQLSRLHAPRGSLLLFLPCSWSIALSCTSHALPPSVLVSQTLLFLTGAIVMRGAGCTINDLWDRKYDALVERTKDRPLASGQVTTTGAMVWLAAQLSVGLAVLVQLNWYSILLGASSLGLVVVYPLMKRITYWPQFVLGLAFNWGALLGSSAVLGSPDWPVVLPLYLGSILWTLHYDTIYAHQDVVDDVHAGVKSTALLFGPDMTKPALSVFSAGFVGLLAYSGWVNGATGWESLGFYGISCAGAGLHLAWQLWKVDLASRPSCWYYFGSNVVTGTIVWAGCFVDYLARVALA